MDLCAFLFFIKEKVPVVKMFDSWQGPGLRQKG